MLNDVIDPSWSPNFDKNSVLMKRLLKNYFTKSNILPNLTCLLQYLIDPTTPLKIHVFSERQVSDTGSM